MLSIFLSQDLEAQAGTIYFFCSAGIEHRDTAIGVLRGLIWHLTIHLSGTTHCARTIVDALHTKYSALDPDSPEHMEDALSSREALWLSFVKLMEEEGLGRIFCILDGLDELDEDSRSWLAAKLLSSKNAGGRNVLKVIVTSREPMKPIDGKHVDLNLDHNEGVSSDVTMFVQIKSLELLRRISLNARQQEDTKHLFQKHIEKTLLVRSQGTFLWLGSVMAELMKEDTITGVFSAMDHLPQGLHEVYEEMLMQIRSYQRNTSLEVLGWVALSRRPLSLQELASAVNCQPPHDWLTIEQTITERTAFCGPLLRIADQEVTLVHESARDYLLLLEGNQRGRDKGLHFSLEEMHSRITKRCIDALVRKQPLSSYATQYWHHHARHSRTLGSLCLYYASSFFKNHSGT